MFLFLTFLFVMRIICVAMNKKYILDYIEKLPEDDSDYRKIVDSIEFRILFEYVFKHRLRFYELAMVLCSNSAEEAYRLFIDAYAEEFPLVLIEEIRELFSDYTKRDFTSHTKKSKQGGVQFISDIYTVNVEIGNNFVYIDGGSAFMSDDYGVSFKDVNDLKKFLYTIR